MKRLPKLTSPESATQAMKWITKRSAWNRIMFEKAESGELDQTPDLLAWATHTPIEDIPALDLSCLDPTDPEDKVILAAFERSYRLSPKRAFAVAYHLSAFLSMKAAELERRIEAACRDEKPRGNSYKGSLAQIYLTLFPTGDFSGFWSWIPSAEAKKEVADRLGWEYCVAPKKDSLDITIRGRGSDTWEKKSARGVFGYWQEKASERKKRPLFFSKRQH